MIDHLRFDEWKEGKELEETGVDVFVDTTLIRQFGSHETNLVVDSRTWKRWGKEHESLILKVEG
ncbi:MAG: hypothetical protein ACFFAS_04010 [Promethearchaeota archaeon]